MNKGHVSHLPVVAFAFLGGFTLGLALCSNQAQAKVSSSFSNGDIIIGYDATCNATYAGSLRYNSGSASVDYCNGSGWMTIATTANGGGSIGGSGGVLLRLTNGSAAAPSLTYLNDTKTGLYYVASNTLNFTTNGVQRMVFGTAGHLNLATATAQYKIAGVPLLRVPYSGTDYTSIASGQNAYVSTPGNTFNYTVAIGTDAMRYETGKDNVAVGYYTTQGVSGTPETNGQTTAVGDYAIQTHQGAAGSNVAVGYKAVMAETNGDSHAVVGYQAAMNAFSQGGHTAFGANAATSVLTGFIDTVVGANALAGGSGAGNYYTLFGYGSFYSSTLESTSVGYQSGYYNVGWDTAFGVQALYGTSSSLIAAEDNTAAGDMALYSGTATMGGDTGIGYQALYSATSGTNNTALGYQAGYAGTAITTSDRNTFIGYQAQSNGATYTNGTAIGNGAILRASNSITFGNSSVTTIYGQPSGITNTSDRREKKDIKALPEDLGLDFINKLKPVSYRFRNGSEILHYGLIAQELEKALPSRFSGLVERPNSATLFGLLNRDGTKPKYFNLNYMELVAPIVRALQQQNRQIEDARKELDSARQEHDDLVQAINANLETLKALSNKAAALDQAIADKKVALGKGDKK